MSSSISPTTTTMCCSPPPSSRMVSTSPMPIPSSSMVPITSDSPTSIRCVVVWVEAIARPSVICWLRLLQPCLLIVVVASRPSRISPIWAQASISPCRISTSVALAICWAPSRVASSPTWATKLTRRSSTKPWRNSETRSRNLLRPRNLKIKMFNLQCSIFNGLTIVPSNLISRCTSPTIMSPATPSACSSIANSTTSPTVAVWRQTSMPTVNAWSTALAPFPM